MNKANSSDEVMELISYLYNFLDDEDKASWTRQEAEEMVKGQRRYEIDRGFSPRGYDVDLFYEVIAEFIAQDEEEEHSLEIEEEIL